MGKRVLILDASDAPCALCERVAELRPYGPEGKSICHDCMMKDEVACRARMLALFSEQDEIRVMDGGKLIALYSR